MMALGGTAAALLVLWIPVGLVEMVVASSGISEALPAAAPPLGLKARLLLAGFAALMIVGMMANMRRGTSAARAIDREEAPVRGAQGARKMGFAFSKLTALARGRTVTSTGHAVPALRRADAHPDAPARAPIFASRDFGGLDIFPRPETGRRSSAADLEGRRMPIVPTAGLDMPSAPAPMAEDDLPRTAYASSARPLGEPAMDPIPLEGPAEVSVAPTAGAPLGANHLFDPPSTHGLSVADLTQRLERGLASRSRTSAQPVESVRVIADMPVAAAVPVRDRVAPDADDALRAALGALRTIASRAG